MFVIYKYYQLYILNFNSSLFAKRAEILLDKIFKHNEEMATDALDHASEVWSYVESPLHFGHQFCMEEFISHRSTQKDANTRLYSYRNGKASKHNENRKQNSDENTKTNDESKRGSNEITKNSDGNTKDSNEITKDSDENKTDSSENKKDSDENTNDTGTNTKNIDENKNRPHPEFPDFIKV